MVDNDVIATNSRWIAVTVAIGIMVIHTILSGLGSVSAFEDMPVNCSEILCNYKQKGEETNCSVAMDECRCQRYSNREFTMECQGLMLLNVSYHSQKDISFTCEKRISDFGTMTPYLDTYLQFIERNFRRLSVRCGCPLDVDAGTGKYNVTPAALVVSNLSLLACYKSALILDLSSNCIANISGKFGSVGQCSSIIHLDLSGNYLSNIPDASFAESNSLKILNMSFNNFTSLDRMTFFNLKSLEQLDLSSNMITTISDYSFSSLTNLSSLNLSSNSLHLLRRETFQGLTSLQELDLSRNEFVSLREEAFRVLPNLKLLSLQHNKLGYLSETVLHNSLQLSYLSIAFNKLATLPSNLFRNMPNLTMFLANDNSLVSIPADLFKEKTNLYAVSFENNNLKYLPPDLLKISSNYVIILDISNNKFEELPHLTMPREEKTLLGQITVRAINNSITSLDLPITGNTLDASVRELDLSDNCIKTLKGPDGMPGIHSFRCVNCCLETISPNLISNVILSLNLSRNRIENVDMVLLKSIAHLLEVDLSHNNIRSINISWDDPLIVTNNKEFPIIETHTNKQIILNHNPITCDCNLIPFLQVISGVAEPPPGEMQSGFNFVVDKLFCSDPPSLRGIPVNTILQNETLTEQFICKTSTDICPDNCICYNAIVSTDTIINCSKRAEPEFPNLSAFEHAILLDLSSSDLKTLPPRNSSEWQFFKKLYLYNNTLDSLKNINVTSTLTVIYLHNNNITEFILPPLIDAFNNNVTVTLSGNPWTCNCDLMKMKALSTASNIMDFDEILCLADNGTQILVANLTLDCSVMAERSGINTAIIVPVFAAILSFIVLVTIILYWKRSSVRICTNKCTGVAEIDDVNKLYDVYLCASRMDSEWVYLNVVSLFQNEQISYRLCFHDDDGLTRELGENAIVDSMHQSRRIMIILTSGFVSSDISSTHLQTAYEQGLRDHVSRLIVVVPEEVPDITKLQPKHASFLRHNTCIYWNKPNFEQKLLFCMPKRQSSPRSNPEEAIEMARA